MTNRHAITINYTNKAQTRHHATDTNIHQRAQGKTLIPITDLSKTPGCGAVGRLWPGLRHTPLAFTKKPLTRCSRQAFVIQRRTLSSRRTPETNCSLVKRLSPRDTARFLMLGSRRIMGVPRRPEVSRQRCVKRYAPHSSCRYCASFSVSLWVAAAPFAASCVRARANDRHIPRLEFVCEHKEDVSTGFSTR
jgi:hypothetical protein